MQQDNGHSVRELQAVDLKTQRAEILKIQVEYATWVASEVRMHLGVSLEEALGGPIADHMDRMLDKFCGQRLPAGIFYLLRVDGEVAGMCGLRRLNTREAEIKRVYVRPAHRGKQLGPFMLRQLIADARACGFRQLLLESAPFMHAAHHLYREHGFVDRPPYAEAEAPAMLHPMWRFMEREV